MQILPSFHTLYQEGPIPLPLHQSEASSYIQDVGVGVISFTAAAIGYLILTLILIVGLRKRSTGTSIFLVSLVTCIWSAVSAYHSLSLSITAFYIAHFLEALRVMLWLIILFRFLGVQLAKQQVESLLKKRLFFISVSICVGLLLLTLIRPLADYTPDYFVLGNKLVLIGFLITSIVGLVLSEQVLKNVSSQSFWQIKFFIISIGGLFLFDFILYSQAVLFTEIDLALWKARGFINLIIIPLILIGSSRTSSRPINISKNLVFHTGVVIGAGAYLLVIALASYYINTFHGSWGEVLQTLFLFTTAIGLLVLLLSGRIRAQVIVFISRNFFPYQYDYREEWLNLTRELTEEKGDSSQSLSLRAVQALGRIVSSTGGAIWVKQETGIYLLTAQNLPAASCSDTIKANEAIIQRLRDRDWIINLKQDNQKEEEIIPLPPWLDAIQSAWLLIPLNVDHELLGVVLLGDSLATNELNWENYDLLRIAAKEIAGFLHQENMANALANAQQFEAYNQMSAFIVHDLKTMASQLSLLVSNAEKHKNNPAFIDDMIGTTRHSAEKLSQLIQHLRGDTQSETDQRVNLYEFFQQVLEKFNRSSPCPDLVDCDTEIFVRLNRAQFSDAVSHIVQNAVDATDESGRVSIQVSHSDGTATIEIADTGCGMSEEFIQKQLFKPFTSTKGVSGMGIGAFQSRELIRRYGGDISVKSEINKGTHFYIKLPIDSNRGDSEN